MIQIGRRWYFNKSTGELIVDTGEREGDVRATTVDEDFAVFHSLQGLTMDQVTVVDLTFGQYRDQINGFIPQLDANGQLVWTTKPEVNP